MSNLVRTSCFVNRRCDRVTAKKDAVSLLKQNCRLLESGNEARRSEPVERSVRGAAPQFLGKDEVASSNLASSSKTPDSEQESGVFFYSAVYSILNLSLLNSRLLRKHRPHPF